MVSPSPRTTPGSSSPAPLHYWAGRSRYCRSRSSRLSRFPQASRPAVACRLASPIPRERTSPCSPLTNVSLPLNEWSVAGSPGDQTRRRSVSIHRASFQPLNPQAYFISSVRLRPIFHHSVMLEGRISCGPQKCVWIPCSFSGFVATALGEIEARHGGSPLQQKQESNTIL